jgi:hypothetical protein
MAVVLNTATIEAITGLNGVSNQTEGTFKVSKPRDEVSVTVEQSHMAPFMGVTSWAAFMIPRRFAVQVLLNAEVWRSRGLAYERKSESHFS